ncbi:MAG: hypothetical protein COA94_02835 [Rickettsiales bacterium]|nr:MAG: hypothetical protein COA94_02835 [Rickettsiales bacterium]
MNFVKGESDDMLMEATSTLSKYRNCFDRSTDSDEIYHVSPFVKLLEKYKRKIITLHLSSDSYSNDMWLSNTSEILQYGCNTGISSDIRIYISYLYNLSSHENKKIIMLKLYRTLMAACKSSFNENNIDDNDIQDLQKSIEYLQATKSPSNIAETLHIPSNKFDPKEMIENLLGSIGDLDLSDPGQCMKTLMSMMGNMGIDVETTMKIISGMSGIDKGTESDIKEILDNGGEIKAILGANDTDDVTDENI